MGMKLLVKTGQPLPMATTDDRCGNAIVAGFCGKGDARHHRCTSYGIYACFLGAKMEVQENLIRGTTWK